MKRWLVRHLLPEPLALRLWRRRSARQPRSALPTASDKRVITIQDGVTLEVFWVDDRLGPGPGASLYMRGDEVLRLDCFGNRGVAGHYHINPRQTELYSLGPARLFFPPGSHEDHIERAAFELKRNLPAFMALNRDARVRGIEIDSARLVEVADDMRSNMLDLLKRHRGST